jgi:hypothetical protein
MSLLKSPVFQFLLVLLVIASLTAALPREQVLGTNIRIVYLHAAWILAGEVTLGFAALCGLVGLISRRINWNRWSAALGLSGLFFWVTSLPLSLWSMQANWNGLFLAEPRFRLAAIFAVAGVLRHCDLGYPKRDTSCTRRPPLFLVPGIYCCRGCSLLFFYW